MLCLMASVALAQTDVAAGTVTNDATQARVRSGNLTCNHGQKAGHGLFRGQVQADLAGEHKRA